VSSYSFVLDQYMSFGISGNNSRTDMIGADVAVVWVKDGVASAVDYILTARQQVSVNGTECLSSMGYFQRSFAFNFLKSIDMTSVRIK